MFSSRMVRCSSPRPATSKMPSSSVSFTRRATLCCSSFWRRSQIWRLVTYLPSRPASGEVFTQKFMVSVGSSTLSMGSGAGLVGSVTVTPIPMSSMPLISTMSPGPASGVCMRSRPWKVSTWLMRPLVLLPSAPSITSTSMPGLILPWLMRPTPMRPTKVEKSSAEICSCSGASGSPLLGGRAELVEQVEGGVDHLVAVGAGLVHLVDHHDGLEAQGQGLFGDKARLRHRAFLGVDQQHHAIDHGQRTLDFTTKVRVAGGVDDVDVGAFPAHGAVLGQDGDAALAFDGVVVHHGVHDFFVVSKSAGLAQQLVHHGGFAVVNVGNDGDVADLFAHGAFQYQAGTGAGELSRIC